MRNMLRRLTWGLCALVLLAINIKLATAHRWSSWHQPDKALNTWNFAVHLAEAEAALNDWDSHTGLSFPRKTSYTDISVFDGNYGDTGWGGLASAEDAGFGWWDCWWWCHIDHGHARVNTFYTGNPAGFSADIQGIFCQEIGHLLGLDHSNDGCMGKGYYNNLNVTVQHNWTDISSLYGGGVPLPPGCCPSGKRCCGSCRPAEGFPAGKCDDVCIGPGQQCP